MNEQRTASSEYREILAESTAKRMKSLLNDVLSSQVVEDEFERVGIFVAIALDLCSSLAIPITDEGIDRLIKQFKELIYNKKSTFDLMVNNHDTRN